MPMLSRRQFLKATGTVALATTTTAGTAAADHYEHQPQHVSLEFDQAFLEKHRPKLVFEKEAREKLIGLFGWVARSNEYEHDVCVYAASYTHQEGLSPFSAALAAPLSDSHLGDHEFYYCFVAEDGTLDHVSYDAYHWIAERRTTDTIPVDGTHPVAKVVSPWHMFNHATTADQGELVDVDDLTTEFQAWLDNGLEDPLAPGTVVDPATMSMGGRPHWWRNDVGSFSFDAAYATALYRAGFLGAEESSLTL